MVEIQDPLIQLVADLDEDAALALVKQRIAAGEDPVHIIHAVNDGIHQVGVLYEQGHYFISGLIMSGEIFRGVMELVQPLIANQPFSQSTGKILLGTVAGDIHDIGKNIAGMLLSCHGFTVIDLGMDVPDVEFARKAIETRPDIVGLSGLITASFESMKTTTQLLHTVSKIHDVPLPILLGGSIVNEQVCRYVGADYWVNDVMSGVVLCQKIMQKKAEATHPLT
jgi:methanogenic corrinoid protein MtbC1